jgi:hypothetical protein
VNGSSTPGPEVTPDEPARPPRDDPPAEPAVGLESILQQARDAISVKRVFGEPIERDGVILIPAAVVVGGGGAGRTADPDRPRDETGGGFGGWARPVGVYVLRDRKVEFRPAIDLVSVLALAAGFLLIRGLRPRRRRRQAHGGHRSVRQPVDGLERAGGHGASR